MLTSHKRPAPKKAQTRRGLLHGSEPKPTAKKSAKSGTIQHTARAHVEVKFDDADAVDTLALQQLTEEEFARRTAALAQLKQEVIQNEQLPLRDMLDAGYSNWVFYRGPVNANLMIIGEAPGKEEAAIGRPFVGSSGKLLDVMLGDQGLRSSEHTFISNLVFLRPSTNNRDPTWEEVNAYLPYLRRMIGIVRPKIVLCMGRLSSSVFSKGRHTQMYSL